MNVKSRIENTNCVNVSGTAAPAWHDNEQWPGWRTVHLCHVTAELVLVTLVTIVILTGAWWPPAHHDHDHHQSRDQQPECQGHRYLHTPYNHRPLRCSSVPLSVSRSGCFVFCCNHTVFIICEADLYILMLLVSEWVCFTCSKSN